MSSDMMERASKAQEQKAIEAVGEPVEALLPTPNQAAVYDLKESIDRLNNTMNIFYDAVINLTITIRQRL